MKTLTTICIDPEVLKEGKKNLAEKRQSFSGFVEEQLKRMNEEVKGKEILSPQ